ncbi:MAG: hypothetical protein V4675_17860 [Verrucomicrobiota bacterium]
MNQELLPKLSRFLQQAGVPMRLEPIEGETFLPGLSISNGMLLVDADRLAWPGDILHEAAHIALTPPSRRPSLGGKLAVSPAEEMAALAWSYAAALAAEIDPAIVFHEGGYKQGGSQLLTQYASGLPPGGPGVPMLQWYGMTTGFPRMNSWLRESEDPA